MIRQRAKPSCRSTGRARPELALDVLACALGQSSRTAARVGGLQQLVELAVGQEGLAPALLLVDVTHDLHFEVLDGHLALTATAAPRIVRLEHLLQVLGLERLSILDDLTGRAQPELFMAVSLGMYSQKPHPQHERQQGPEDDDRKGVHRGRSLNAEARCTAILGDR
jgi:hypothetical protein